LKFWDIIQQKAKEQHKTFFLDCGEGNEFENQEIECENLSGWLIPDDKLEEFQKVFTTNTISDEWEDTVAFVSWSFKEGNIMVEFE